MDAQGYSCQVGLASASRYFNSFREDYYDFGACDVKSQDSDPLARGGRLHTTPEYFEYQFLYETGSILMSVFALRI